MSENLERSFSPPDSDGDYKSPEISVPPPKIERVNEIVPEAPGAENDVVAEFKQDEEEGTTSWDLERTFRFFDDLESKIDVIDEKYEKQLRSTKPLEYLKEIRDLKKSVLRASKSLEERMHTINYFDSALVIESQVIRNAKDLKTKKDKIEKLVTKGLGTKESKIKKIKIKENLAIPETQWQIELADFYLNSSEMDKKLTAKILDVCVNRFAKTSKIFNYGEDYIGGRVRGLVGLIANTQIFRQIGCEVELPTAGQDAVKKIDLIVIDLKNKIKYLCQLKTKAVYTKPYVDKITSKRPVVGNEEEQDYIREMNILLESAMEMQREEKDLTVEAMGITISEREIKNFEPTTSLINQIKQQLASGR